MPVFYVIGFIGSVPKLLGIGGATFKGDPDAMAWQLKINAIQNGYGDVHFSRQLPSCIQ